MAHAAEQPMRLSPELVLYGYSRGVFPMADPDLEDEIHWYAPDPRAVLPLDAFRISRSLRRAVKSGLFKVTLDRRFGEIMGRCADRSSTWISPEIISAYSELHELGFAHSVEVWVDEMLAGGLYGVALGGAFFGESMFHVRPNASKVALVHLVRCLNEGGFELLDVQFITSHLQQFGAIEVSRNQYQSMLEAALERPAEWPRKLPVSGSGTTRDT
jgi:leucyl/phenylalanyl-tRNA--protein transferase